MILFLYGDDTLTMLREVAELRKKFLVKSHPQAVEEFEPAGDIKDDMLRSRLQELLESQGLFAREKFVILRNFVGAVSDYPQSQEYLSEVLSRLPKTTTVIFLETDPADARLKFFKKLSKLAEAREFSVPSQQQLPKWVEKRLMDEGLSADAAALQKFLEYLGVEPSLWRVESEIKKLKLFAAPRQNVTTADIEAVVIPSFNQTVFSITDAFAAGDVRAAVVFLERLLQGGNLSDTKGQTIQIVGALAAQLRSLLLVKDLESGHGAGQIAKILGWKEGRVWINQKLSKKFTADRLQKMLRDLKAIDLRLKTSDESPKLLLSLFLQKAAQT
jgi:DNA polymerase-3 subunit delta